MDDSLSIKISKAEAIVLFDLLESFRDQSQLPIRNAAERVALWALCTSFERELTEPFSSDYTRILDEARRAVKMRYGITAEE